MIILHPPLSHDNNNVLMRSLLAEAKRAREFATSWRNYHVGAAAAGLLQKGKGVIKIFPGCNIKLNGNSQTNKFCAEPIAIGSALAAGCCEIVALAIVGKPEPPQNGPTLHPCPSCLMLLSDIRNLNMLADNFVVITAWQEARETFTLDELLALHPL